MSSVQGDSDEHPQHHHPTDLKEQFEQQQVMITNIKKEAEGYADKLSIIKSRARKSLVRSPKGDGLTETPPSSDLLHADPKSSDKVTPSKGLSLLRQKVNENRAIFEQRGREMTESKRGVAVIVEQLKAQLDERDTTIRELQTNLEASPAPSHGTSRLLEGSDESFIQHEHHDDSSGLPVSKDYQIAELNNKVLALEAVVIGLRENLLEKDSVIDARTKAISLMSEDLCRKSKSTVDQLEETREEMRRMQNNFVAHETTMKEEKEELNRKLEAQDKKVLQLEASKSELEGIRSELTSHVGELQEALETSRRELAAPSVNVTKPVQDDDIAKSLSDANKQIVKLKALTKKQLKQLNSLRKVSDANAKILDLQNRIAELEEEKGNLQLHVVDFDELKVSECHSEKRIVQLESQIATMEAQTKHQADADTNTSNLEIEKQELEIRLSDWEVQVGELHEELRRMEEMKVRAELKSVQLEEDIDILEKEKANLASRLETLEEKVASSPAVSHFQMEKDLATIHGETTIFEGEQQPDLLLDNLQAQLDEKSASLCAIETQLEAVFGTTSLDSWVEQVGTYKTQIDTLAQQLAFVQQETLKQSNDVNVERNIVNEKTTNLDERVMSEQVKKDEVISELTENVNDLNKTLDRKTGEYQELASKHSKLTEKMKKVVANLKAKVLQSKGYEDLVSKLQLLVEEKDSMINQLQEKNAELKEICGALENDIFANQRGIQNAIQQARNIEQQLWQAHSSRLETHPYRPEVDQFIDIPDTTDNQAVINLLQDELTKVGDALCLLQNELRAKDDGIKRIVEANDQMRDEYETRLVDCGQRIANLECCQQDNNSEISGYLEEISRQNVTVEELKQRISSTELSSDRIAQLSGQLDEAKQLMVLQSSELLEAQEFVSQQETKVQDALGSIADLTVKLQEANEVISQHESKSREAQDVIADLTVKLQEAHTVIAEDEIKLQEAYEVVSPHESKLKDAQNAIADLAIKLQSAQNQIAEDEIKLQEAQEVISQHERTLMEAQDTIADLTMKQEKTETAIAEAKIKLQEAHRVISQHESELKEARDTLAELAVKLEEAHDDNETLRLNLQKSDLVVMEQNTTLNKDQGVITQQTARILEANNTVAQLHAELLDAQKQHSQQESMLKETQDVIADLGSKLLQAQEEIASQNTNIQDKDYAIAQLNVSVQGFAELMSQQEPQLHEFQNLIAQQNAKLQEGEDVIAQQNVKLQELQELISQQASRLLEAEELHAENERQHLQSLAASNAKLQEQQAVTETLDAELKKTLDRIQRLEGSLEDNEETRKMLENKTEALDLQLRESDRSHTEIAEKEGELEQKLQRIMSESENLKLQLRSQEDSNGEMYQLISDLKVQIADLEKNLSNAQNKLKVLQAENERLTPFEQQFQYASEEVNALTNELSKSSMAFEQKYNKIIDELQKTNANLESMCSQFDECDGERRILLEKCEKLGDEKLGLESDLEDSSYRLEDSIVRIGRLEMDVRELETKLNVSEELTRTLRAHSDSLEAKLDHGESQLKHYSAEAEAKISFIENEIEAAQRQLQEEKNNHAELKVRMDVLCADFELKLSAATQKNQHLKELIRETEVLDNICKNEVSDIINASQEHVAALQSNNYQQGPTETVAETEMDISDGIQKEAPATEQVAIDLCDSWTEGGDEGWGWGSEEAKLEEEHQVENQQREQSPENIATNLANRLLILETKVEDLETEKDKLTNELKAAQVRNGKLIKKLKELKAVPIPKSSNSLDDTMENEFILQIQSLEKDVQSLKAEKDSTNKEKQQLNYQVEALEWQISELMEDKSKMLESIDWYEKQIQAKENEIAESSSTIKRLLEDSSGLSDTNKRQYLSVHSSDEISGVAVALPISNEDVNQETQNSSKDVDKMVSETSEDEIVPHFAGEVQMQCVGSISTASNQQMECKVKDSEMEVTQVESVKSQPIEYGEVRDMLNSNNCLLTNYTETKLELERYRHEFVALETLCNEYKAEYERLRIVEDMFSVNESKLEELQQKDAIHNADRIALEKMQQSHEVVLGALEDTRVYIADLEETNRNLKIAIEEKAANLDALRHSYNELQSAYTENQTNLVNVLSELDSMRLQVSGQGMHPSDFDHLSEPNVRNVCLRLSNENKQMQSMIEQLQHTSDSETLNSEINLLSQLLFEEKNKVNELNERYLLRDQDASHLKARLEIKNVELEDMSKELKEQLNVIKLLKAVQDNASRSGSSSRTGNDGEQTDTEFDDYKNELDLALYLLHQKEMRCDELTLELMQLLEERDTLQIRLSTALRTNEELRRSDTTAPGTPSTTPSSPNAIPVNQQLSVETSSGAKVLANKLDELRSVGRQQRQMALQQQRNSTTVDANYTVSRDAQSTSETLLNWIWGRSTPKVEHI